VVGVARPLRSALPDGIYHVSARAVHGAWLFRDDDDRRTFLGLLALVVERHAWRVHAFCLMGTHFHVIVEAHREDLSWGMKMLNGRYAQGLNG
jgi:putative transposase